MKWQHYLTSFAFATALLSCSPSPQDAGGSGDGQPVRGLALDGYIARAVIYVDTNNNNKLEPWEPRAITDRDGYYGQSKDGADYCADDAGAFETIHCLRANLSPNSNIIIRSSNGYDTGTNENFRGSLAVSVTTDADGGASGAIMTPLTTVLTYMSDDEKQAFSQSLGLTEEELRSDFMDFSNTDLDGNRDVLLAAALQVQKTVEAIAARLENQYNDIGESTEIPKDASGYVYGALAQQLSDNGGRLDIALGQSSQIQQIIENAETDVRTALMDQALTPETPLSVNVVVSTADAGQGLQQTITGLFSNGQTETEVNARMRAVELLVAKIRDNPEDTSIDEAQTLVASNSVLTALEDENVDLAELSDNITDGMDTGDQTTVDTLISDSTITATLPADVTGMQLSGTNNPGSSDEGGAVFYFLQEDAAVSDRGKLVLCLRFDSAGDDENDTTGARFDGTWSRLNEYTLVLNLTVAGSNQSSILKSKRIDENGTRHFLFDYNDDDGEWQSESDFENIGDSVPADDAACKQVLPAAL